MIALPTLRSAVFSALLAATSGVTLTLATPATAQTKVTAFAQAVAEAAALNEEVAGFYRANAYQPIWTGQSETDVARRTALLSALAKAGDHALPVARYDLGGLQAQMNAVASQRDLGALEVAFSTLYLTYAHDVQTGILVPSSVDNGIKRTVERRDGTELLQQIAASDPYAFMRSLPPQTPEYGRLMRARFQMEEAQAAGGWGPTVNAERLEFGDSGPQVIALRNRLTAMGYLSRSATTSYDTDIQRAVQTFQTEHGLLADGIAGPSTVTELNVPVQQRLESIAVAMERERWMNVDRGNRYVWVNLTDFSARIYDGDRITFETRSVIGARSASRQSPEFSDEIEYMDVNPTWSVPRSIVVGEYLPAMQQNPGAAGHLTLLDRSGRAVSRENIDFTQYTANTFPYAMRQAPSRSNALGLVKFMFPNRYNIYLHDTPQKSLFGRETRAFSHGCIRLQDPFDFAYALLSAQEADPQAVFHAALNSGRTTTIRLEEHVPVHLVYRTAFTDTQGTLNFRPDVYGRDARIWSALQDAGVSLMAVQG